MTLQDLIQAFLADICGGKTNQTEATYRGKLRRLTVFFGEDYDPARITMTDLDRFKRDLETRKKKLKGTAETKGALSPFTIRTCMVTVRFLFSWAYAKGHLPNNPMKNVRISTPPPPQPKAIMGDTVIKLLNAAATHGENWERARNVSMLYLLRDSGGRAGGLIGARLGDLDLRRGWLMVTEKGGRSRPLPLIDTTLDALRVWLNWRPVLHPVDDRLFITIRGTGFTYHGLRSLLRELAIKAGIEGERCNAHSFRHAYARDLLLAGAELSQVAALMGHTDTRVTSMYYARWSIGELKTAHNKYSPVLGMPEIKPEFESETL